MLDRIPLRRIRGVRVLLDHRLLPIHRRKRLLRELQLRCVFADMRIERVMIDGVQFKLYA